MTQDSKKWYYDLQLWLVGATWGLVIVTLWASCISTRRMGEQVDEFRTATRIQSMPFLLISKDQPKGIRVDGKTRQLSAVDGSAASEWRDLSGMRVGSDDWFEIVDVRIRVLRQAALKNAGRMPAILERYQFGVLGEQQWIDRFRKGKDQLRAHLRDSAELHDPDVAMIILPDSTVSFKLKAHATVMPVDRFENRDLRRKYIIVYPYVYMEYRDQYHNRYGLLYMRWERRAVSASDSGIVIDAVSESGPEVWEWYDDTE